MAEGLKWQPQILVLSLAPIWPLSHGEPFWNQIFALLSKTTALGKKGKYNWLLIVNLEF